MHQDAIVIYHREEAFASEKTTTPVDSGMTIEFSNSKSKELFGVDLHSAANSLNAVDFDYANEKLRLP